MTSLLESVEVVICTRNRPQSLCRTIEKTRQAGLACPIWIYDDASDVPTANLTIDSLGRSKVIAGRRWEGPAFGRNALMNIVSAPFALFLDDDTYPQSAESVAAAALFLAKNPHYGAVTARLVRSYDGRDSCPPYGLAKPVAFLNGGGSLIRAQSFAKIGGYRETLRFGCEDTDLAWRLIGASFSILEEPSFVIFHDHVSQSRDLAWEAFQYGRNTVLLWALNRHWPGGLIQGLIRGIAKARRTSPKLPCLSGSISGVLDSFRLKNCSMALSDAAWQQIRDLQRPFIELGVSRNLK